MKREGAAFKNIKQGDVIKEVERTVVLGLGLCKEIAERMKGGKVFPFQKIEVIDHKGILKGRGISNQCKSKESPKNEGDAEIGSMWLFHTHAFHKPDSGYFTLSIAGIHCKMSLI